MNSILLFVVPPVAGAIIGFSTNVVAIRMLFRPLKEIRIFGIRLPFTPGILPRQRHRLAQSIGAMVERELLTADILRQRLLLDDVREKIKESLSNFTGKILSITPGSLVENFEAVIAGNIASLAENLYPRASAALLDFLRSREVRRELEIRGRVFLASLILKLNVFQRFFLSAAKYDSTLEQKMPEIIDELICNVEILLQENNIKEKLINSVTDAFNQLISDKHKNLNEILNISVENKKNLDEFLFQKLMTMADGQMESILNSINIKNLVSDRIDSLDMIKVERIILDVMADQFMWINIFGGILGFLIGMFQIAFTMILR
jgi:uncharacterized membrane protein YheB (UPF0754 family)